MLNSVEINKISRAAKNMKLGEKIVAMIGLLNALHEDMLNCAFTAAGLAIGTSDPAKVKIANTVTFVIGGVFKSKTTAEVAFTTTAHDIAPHASLVKERVYLLSLKSDLTAIITAGVIAVGAGNALVPSGPSGQAVIGHVRIAVAAGATPFTAGTTQLSNGALTVTYTDLTFRPDDLGALIATLNG